MGDITLEEWVRGMAVLAKQLFDNDGYIEPVAFIETEGKLSYLKLDFSDADAKDMCADAIRSMCAKPDVERVLMITESWITEVTDEKLFDKIQAVGIVASGVPRREVIMFRAEDREEMITAEYEIIRNKAGKPTLKPFKIVRKMDWTEGRFANFMPRPKETRH